MRVSGKGKRWELTKILWDEFICTYISVIDIVFFNLSRNSFNRINIKIYIEESKDRNTEVISWIDNFLNELVSSNYIFIYM